MSADRSLTFKAKKTNYGYVVKRKASKPHQCRRCWGIIEAGKEYYQVTNRRGRYQSRYGTTKAICEGCWVGVSLAARGIR
jgi:hypothetical protein